jgi:L-fuculose-phosphate aldolase
MAATDALRRSELRTALIEAGRFFHAESLVDSHGGNVSSRVAEGSDDGGEGAPATSMLITATGAMLGRLAPAELVEVPLSGAAASATGARAPSSDTATHLAVYRAHPDANAVLHGHPACTIALSLDDGRDAIEPLDLEGRHFLGRVPVIDVEWAEQAEAVAEALREASVVVTRGHGPYARGDDPWDALRLISALEKSARVMLLARGGVPLPP